jgi:hypothetical protein
MDAAFESDDAGNGNGRAANEGGSAWRNRALSPAGEVLRARGERTPGFRDVIRARLVRELRRYYPHGSIGESLLDALMLLLMRCALDGTALDTTLLDEGPSGLEESPEPCVSDERGRVVVQVIEALAPHLMELYHAAVRDHWLAPLEGVAQGLVLLARIKAALDGWASGLDDLLTPGGVSNPHAALEELDAAQAELLMSLTLDALLTPQEAAVFGQILGNNLPYWLRLAADGDKAQLEALAARVLELEDAIALATDGLESLPRFVEVEVAEHVRHAHGVLMDPIKVLVASAYATEQGEQVRTSTLIELLLAGPYRPRPDVRRQVEQVPDGAKAGAIDWLDLLETFDARAQYVEALGTFYHGQEGRSLLVTTLYNPSTRRGAVLNIDHGIARPARDSVARAVESLGPVDPARPVQGAVFGGDWLTLPGDIFKEVNHALGLSAVLTRPDHWLVGNGLGGATGVLLDLKTGALLVWRRTSQGRKWFYDPLRQYPAFGDANVRMRVRRFWARVRGGRWHAGEGGGFHNKVMTLEGELAEEAVAIPLHLLD